MILDLLEQTAISIPAPADPLKWLTMAFSALPEADQAGSLPSLDKPFVTAPVLYFENELAKFFDVKHAVICASHHETIQVSLLGLGLEPGDEVIVPALGARALVGAIEAIGLKAIIADVDPNTFQLTTATIKPCLTSRSRAIVPVHLFG